MDILDMLDKLQRKALTDEATRQVLIETRREAEPLIAFCKAAQKLGYEINPMELIAAGEEFHALMKRSTNGGGENSPKLTAEDDFYDMFFAVLEKDSED